MDGSTSTAQHGQIRCGTLTVRDINKSLSLYQDLLGFQLIESGHLTQDTAYVWNLPKMEGAKYAVLQALSGGPALLRLIELPNQLVFVPATTFGWTAFEICVADVFTLFARLANTDFHVVGPPKLVDGFTSFIPMQVYGPDGEVLFLNQVNHSDDDADLPIAQCDVDQFFIAVLGAKDREKSFAQYCTHLHLDAAATHTLRYSLLNRAFALAPETKHSISMVQKGRATFAQIDQMPEGAAKRPRMEGCLPPGNAMVSIWVDDIEALDLSDKLLVPIVRLSGTIYQNQKVAVIKGDASEYIELIQIN